MTRGHYRLRGRNKNTESAAETGRRPNAPHSEADLATAPMAAELVVADLRACLHAEPLRQRPVHVQLLGEVLLRLEGLHRAHGCKRHAGRAGFGRGSGRKAGALEPWAK